MQDIYAKLIEYGYVILFLYTLGGGMVAVIAAGILSGLGKLDLTICIAVAAVSNALGDMILFYFGRYNKQAIMPFLKKHRRKFALSQIWIKRYGDFIIFIQKYIYGVKTIVPMIVGFGKYPALKFAILNLIFSVIWSITLCLASYFASDFVLKFLEITGVNGYMMPIIVVFIFGGLWLYFSKITKKRI